jgi:hypothetical protein
MLKPTNELANHAEPAPTANVAAPGAGMVVVVVVLVCGVVLVVVGGNVVGTTGHWQSPVHAPPPGQRTPPGSQASPRDGVTRPSPQRASHSDPPAAQHERHVCLNVPHA